MHAAPVTQSGAFGGASKFGRARIRLETRCRHIRVAHSLVRDSRRVRAPGSCDERPPRFENNTVRIPYTA
jgi:hypothetical protein